MGRRMWIAFICGAMLALASTPAAMAQRRVPGFVNRPALSPYVNLFQSNNGGLNSYFTFVRPRLEMDRFMRQTAEWEASQRAFVAQESVQLQRSLEETLEDTAVQLRPTNSSAIRRPPARFMQYAPFYPTGNQAATTRATR